MIFDREDLYSQDPDLDLLQLSDLSDCPSNYSDNENHFIFFYEIDSQPVWCSEPVQGTAISPNQFAQILSDQSNNGQFLENQLELLQMLNEPLLEETVKGERKLLDLVSESFRIIEFTE